jgi:transcriptional regulator with XRE-family HTH domain
MTRGHTSAISQRRVLVALREARDAQGLTQKDVAEALDWSPSKLLRIENGTVGLSITDLKALLLHYGITDREKVEAYVKMAKDGKAPAWWDEFRHTNSVEWVKFLGLEWSAVAVRQFQLHLVPGLLQVPEYTRALFARGLGTDEAAERNVRMRALRQKRLQDDELEHFFILDESVLRRRGADAGGWRAQLGRLREMSARPNISIRVLPFKAGWVPGMQSSFTLLSLSDQQNDLFLAIEQPDGDQFFDEAIGAEKAVDFMKIFHRLEEAALSEAETTRLIDDLLTRMED